MVGVEEGREFCFCGDLYSQESTFPLVSEMLVFTKLRVQRVIVSVTIKSFFLLLLNHEYRACLQEGYEWSVVNRKRARQCRLNLGRNNRLKWRRSVGKNRCVEVIRLFARHNTVLFHSSSSESNLLVEEMLLPCVHYDAVAICGALGWLGSRVVNVLDSRAV